MEEASRLGARADQRQRRTDIGTALSRPIATVDAPNTSWTTVWTISQSVTAGSQAGAYDEIRGCTDVVETGVRSRPVRYDVRGQLATVLVFRAFR